MARLYRSSFGGGSIEGFTTLERQNWLYAHHRRERYLAKKDGRKAPVWGREEKEPTPTVTFPWPKRQHLACIELLIKYDDAPEPAYFGKWNVTLILEECGLLDRINPGKRVNLSDPVPRGVTFQLSKAGREYLSALRQRPARN